MMLDEDRIFYSNNLSNSYKLYIHWNEYSLIIYAMKKVYYEVHEFENGDLKNMYYFSYNDILESKRSAEQCYKMKVTENENKVNSPYNYQLILTILNDYKTTRHILNQGDPDINQLESKILSELTGRLLEVPEWSVREHKILRELV